jgi:uncharacterized RDD family membrane protein YckC
MKRMRMAIVMLLAGAATGLPASVAGQMIVRYESDHWERSVLRIGQNYILEADAIVGEAVVVFGDATIEGRVDRDVVVVLGKAQLASTAVIEGSLIVVGGGANAMAGALIGRDLFVLGGPFDAPAGFYPGGQHIVIGPAALGGRLESIVPWITRGLLWGRPIVPDLPWVWRIVGVFFLVYLILSLFLHEPVRVCADTLAGRPLTVFVVGLLVLLLTGPVCLLLAVSMIGLAVVPIVLSALFVGAIIGKVGVARWIGMGIVRQESPESRLQSLRSFAIGFALICLAYMVPLLGFVAWTLVGVFGLGAASLGFISAYRRENPVPAPRVRNGHPALPAPAPPQYADASSPNAEPAALAFTPSVQTAPPAVSDLASFPHAPFLDRLAAFVLDVVLVVIAAQYLDRFRPERDSAIFLLLLAYHIGFWTWKGTTVGGIICQLRLVRVDGSPLRFVDALVRGLSSIFSLAVLGLGGLWILKDPERQAWHDRIAGTYVVKVPRNWPL